MKSEAAFEQFLNNFNRTTGIDLTIEEVNKLLKVNKKPLFMRKAEHEAEVCKRRDAMRIAMNNIVIMRDELVDDENYYNEVAHKYNVLCEKCDRPTTLRRALIPLTFVFTDLPGRNPMEWEKYMKDRITYLVEQVRELRREINYLESIEAGQT